MTDILPPLGLTNDGRVRSHLGLRERERERERERALLAKLSERKLVLRFVF